MRKKKWKKILIWTVSIVFVLGVGGLFAANYAMNKLISSLSSSLESELLENPVVGEASPSPSGEPKDSNESSVGEDIKPGTTNESGNESEPDKSATGNEATSPSTSSDSGYQGEVTVDKAKETQEKITVGEKAQLASVFLKELSVDDIKALQGLASGGLSLEEKKEARSLIMERLSPEQYNELILIAKKHGLSQGKSYEDVSKE